MKNFINNISLNFIKNKNKKNIYIIFLFLITIFLIPINIYGIVDQEEYTQSIFSTKLAFNNPGIVFENFIDFIGIGSDFPISNFLLHPSIILLKNIKLYYLSFVFLNILIQCFFLKRLLTFFNQKIPNFFLFFFIIFSNSNFNYVYLNEYIILMKTGGLSTNPKFFFLKMIEDITILKKYFKVFFICIYLYKVLIKLRTFKKINFFFK